jgi:hypothetical protein
MEGSSHGLFYSTLWHLLGVTEREPRNLRIVGGLIEIRTEHLYTSQKHYCFIQPCFIEGQVVSWVWQTVLA